MKRKQNSASNNKKSLSKKMKNERVVISNEVATEPCELIGLGWTIKLVQRQQKKGNSKKGHHIDKYWYTPTLKKQIRSISKVHEFLTCMKICHNNEHDAWKLLQQGQHIRNVPIAGDNF